MAAGSLRVGTDGQGLPQASGVSGSRLSGRPGVWDPRGQRTRPKPVPSSHLTTGPGRSRERKALVLSNNGRSARPV